MITFIGWGLVSIWHWTATMQHTHTHPFNGPLFRTTRVSRYQKGKTNLDFTEAWDSEWQWHQLGRMQVCTLLQTDDHASTSPLSFFTDQMPFLPPNQQHQSTEATIQQFALKFSRVKSAMVSAILAPQYPLHCQYVTSHDTTLNWDTWSKPTIISWPYTGQPPLASKPVKTWILGFVPAKFYYMPLLMATSAFGLGQRR